MRDRGSHRFNSRMIRVDAGSFSLTGCIGRPIPAQSRLLSPWDVRKVNCPLRHSAVTMAESDINKRWHWEVPSRDIKLIPNCQLAFPVLVAWKCDLAC